MTGRSFAQSGTREVGFLHPGNVGADNQRLADFRTGLRTKGFIDGQNVAVVVRAASYDNAKLAQQAEELVNRKPAVLFTVGPLAVREVQRRTKTQAIVALDLESDPVAAGFVQSLARPGGNVTGLFFDYADFSGKWLELMGEILPGLRRAAAMWDPSSGTVQVDAAQAMAAKRGVTLDVIMVDQPSAFDSAFRTAVDKKAQAILVLTSPVFGTLPRQVADLALKYRLPMITMFPEFAEQGALITYGTDQRDLFRQSGEIVGKVLAGANIAELPVERPSSILLYVNMKTAAALGVKIPQVISLRADQVIE
ncbi:MAG TPA: ABC transporter substrate-binding protein [Reyranella sp.]|nr:ABC transporter substrate-binding protein [Reyranella sp.]